jgi:4,5:9,10-diseco-3-hydroxy-5,9,17-trioxoandrosta-1(10),2-diene-4-oate hydrolase
VVVSVTYPEIEEGFVLVGGVKVHYECAGKGRPLLLLHGLVGSAKNWRQNIGFLAGDSRVYAVDLSNMGESERVPGLDAGLEATADRVVECMDALGLDEADVAGHSHGGAVPFFPRMLKATALSRMYGDPSLVTEDALEGYIAGLHVPGTIDHVLQIVRRWPVDMGLLRSSLTHLAGKPTLLIWGDRDRAVGLSSGRQLQSILPLSRLIVIPGVGHIPFEEQPDVCNRAMRDWLASTPPAA